MGNEAMGVDVMRANDMKSKSRRSQGFTLIASLLMLLMLSGIAIGLMMMVNTEGKVGGSDLQNNMAFHAAEGGIEKMYSDLSAVFQNVQSPSASQICGVGATANQPSMLGVTWTQYSVMPGTQQGSTCPSTLTTTWGQISSGPNQGLWAQVIPVNMLATAQFPGGQEVSMTRTAQVALIPVFQFGVFCEGDCGFFDSPNLNFNGRVHTNADLYLGVSGCCTLTFHNRLTAFGNVVTEVLPNGLPSTGSSWDDTGNVYIPTANNGCSTPLTNCVLKAANNNPASSPFGDGSLQGAGGNPPQSSYNGANWNTFSKTTTNKMLVNGNYGSVTNAGTGAKKLKMPFVSGTTFPFEIIRRAQSTDSTALTQSREEDLAQIHVLLSDDPAELPTVSVRL
jgi:Tfp pilus assembly protein PilX